MTLKQFTNADELSNDWNQHCNSLYQKKAFLKHCEKYNSCQQTYFEYYLDNKFVCGAILYKLRLNLLTYLSIPSPISFKIIGIPCSVSCSGVIGNQEFFSKMVEEIKEQTKGLFLVLNFSNTLDTQKLIQGKTLPSLVLKHSYLSFDEYLNSLRAHYRRRFHRIHSKFTEVQIQQQNCSNFNEVLYDQYLQVLKKSKGKLETLSFSFFKNLPSPFSLNTFSVKNTTIGWCITSEFDNTYSFFLGGIDYNYNHQYQTYFNILFYILRQGIEKSYNTIDFGQTAEVPKSRTGADFEIKYMLAGHSNPLFHQLLKLGKNFLEYSQSFESHKVFKEN